MENLIIKYFNKVEIDKWSEFTISKKAKGEIMENTLSAKLIVCTILIMFFSLNAKGLNELNNIPSNASNLSSEINHDISFSDLSSSYSGSMHDLSIISATNQQQGMQTEKCIFCHTPSGGVDKNVLWNKTNPISSDFTKITNVILSTQSLQCLSCHDGTTAANELTNVTTSLVTMVTNSSATNMNDLIINSNNVRPNTANIHPIGVDYPILGDANFNSEVSLNYARLFDGKVTCASCHNPHGSPPKFLIASNEGSALCLDCHIK